MLSLRLQSVFLSLGLFVILFLVLYYLIIGLVGDGNITSVENFEYFLFFCFILIMPAFYGIFVIIGSILLALLIIKSLWPVQTAHTQILHQSELNL